MKAIDFYVEKIEGFEEMSYEDRRYWVEYECLESAKNHTKATLKGLFRMKPKPDAKPVSEYENDYKQTIYLYTFSQCVPMRSRSTKPRSDAQKEATKKLVQANFENSVEQQTALACKEMIESGECLVLDTETTSLDGVAIQLSIVDLTTMETLIDTYIKNSEPIEQGAFEVHGISEEMLADAPSQDQVWEIIAPMIKDKTLIAFNSSFDYNVCRKTFGKNFDTDVQSWVCAMYHIAVPVLGATNKYGTISLSNACYYANVELVNAHDAQSDARATALLVHKIAERAGQLHPSLIAETAI